MYPSLLLPNIAFSFLFSRPHSARFSWSACQPLRFTASPRFPPLHARFPLLFQAAVALSQVIAQEPWLLATAGWLVLGDVEAAVADDGGGPGLAGLEKAVF